MPGIPCETPAPSGKRCRTALLSGDAPSRPRARGAGGGGRYHAGMETGESGAGSFRIVVDDRERAAGLAAAVAQLWSPVYEGRLPVGDVEVGPRVLVERKTVSDFAVSLADGRLFRQAHALSQATLRPLLVVEGEDGFDALGIAPKALRGVLLTLLVGFRVPLLRTGSLAETAVTIAAVAKQEAKRLARERRGGTRGVTRARAILDVLGTIPGIGDERARRLVHEFGTLAGIAGATPEDLRRVPGIGPAVAREIRRACGEGDRPADGPGDPAAEPRKPPRDGNAG